MAYNLPPPWDPGYALPKNARDEGLERRAFVTKWAPRGTYDNETDGTGGYAVPDYVKKEGTGQGTFTTAWAPSGSYVGPAIPHFLNKRPQVVKQTRLPGGGTLSTIQTLQPMSGMGDDQPLPKQFENYGAKAAAMLIARVASLPSSKRGPAMRAILDKIDKSLWTRTQDIWKRYRAQGMQPGPAFQAALGRALSTGIAAEIINTGLTSSAPQAQSLLGLGCYGGRSALGATSGGVSGAASMYGTGTSGATCAPPAGFTWVPAAGAIAAHWERLKAGQTPVNGPCGAGGAAPTVTTNVHPAGSVGGVTGGRQYTYLYVGPFAFKSPVLASISGSSSPLVDVSRNADIVTPDPSGGVPIRPPNVAAQGIEPMYPEVAQWIKTFLTQTDPPKTWDTTPTPWNGTNTGYQWTEESSAPWFNAFGIPAGTLLPRGKLRSLRLGMNPVVWTTDPSTGEKLQIHVILNTVDHSKPWNAASNPVILRVYISKIGDVGWFQSIVDGVLGVLATVADVVIEGVKDLGDLACDLLSTPGVGAAAGAAGGAVAGVPPQQGAQAGQAGAAIAQGICKSPQQPPPLLPQPSILPMVLLAGGAVLAVALIAGRKKTS